PKRQERVHRRNSLRRLLNAPCLSADLLAQPLKYFKLQLVPAFLGVKDYLLLLLEFRRDKTLRVGERLFADVFGGNLCKLRIRDFDIIAKDSIESNLQIGNPRSLDFLLAHRGDPRL